jgi:hypothetical protein
MGCGISSDYCSISYNLKISRICPNPYQKIILQWKANSQCDRYHWWPMTETSENADDPANNLYAISGGLGKYDKVKKTECVAEQRKNYFKKWDSNDSDAKWSGFCDKASILSCLYPYPKYDVIWEGITFTPTDIESLMIIACENSIQFWKSEFHGERNNGLKQDVQDEPLPSQLLEILTILSKETTPFVMDIDSDIAVWNYAYDSIDVREYATTEFNIERCGKGEKIYYIFEIQSCGYSDHNQILHGWINQSTGDEGWFSKSHPDFLWRRYKKNSIWKGQCLINKEIDATDVYYLYTQSMENSL